MHLNAFCFKFPCIQFLFKGNWKCIVKTLRIIPFFVHRDGDVGTNRGNDLLVKLLKHRYHSKADLFLDSIN